MDNVLNETESKMKKAIETMEKRFTNVRAGRANPAILDGVMVSYYGTPTPLKSLATISIPEARQLMIKPFDRSSLSDIEKGIYEANIGLTPNNNGECIILNIPALTEETRKLINKDKIDKMQRWLEGKGAAMAFFSFLPVVGDIIALALGFMRANVYIVNATMFAGKFVRYVLIMYGVNWII